MTRLGIFVGEDNWSFFNEIYAQLKVDFSSHVFERKTYKVPILYERINRWVSHERIQSFLRQSDVCFFEWASELLAVVTHMPKRCGIVTRLHRFELYEWADRVNWDAVDKIILVSEAKQQEFIAKFPNQASKTMVSFPSISLDHFSNDPKEYKGDIGILCHISPRKRIYDLILTFYDLLQKNSGFHLHIAGDVVPEYKDYSKAIHYLIDELGLQDKITFDGKIDNTREWFHNIDIFVSNSYSEGLQVAPMEAMASGVYCLSHHWEGADELLPPNHLFHTNNELIEKILAYADLSDLERQKERNDMRAIACAKFDIRQSIAQIVQAIHEVAA